MPLTQFASIVSGFVIDATLKATALLILAWLAARLLSRSSAAVRHRLWSLTMLGLLLLPALSGWLPAWRLPVLPTLPDRSALTIPVEPTRVEQVVAEVPAEEPASELAWEESPVVSDAEASTAPVAEVASAHSPRTIEPRDSWPWGSLIGIGIWSCGVLVCLTGLACGLWRVRHLSRNSLCVGDSHWNSLVAVLRSRLRLRRNVELRESSESIIPLTWGVLRPKILIPPQAATWTDSMRRAVLLHELAHVQRADVLYQLLGRMACALYWFHPLAWLALKHLRQEREQACDDAVLETGEQASSYAEQLLEVARLYCRPQGLTLAVEVARTSQLEQRLRAMFDAARSHAPLNRLWGWGLGCAILICATGIAVVELVSEEPASESVQIRDESGRLVLEAGLLAHVVQIVDSQQQPVVGAKLVQLGYGTARGSGCPWGKDWPTDFVTDENGKVEILVPDTSEVAASGEKGIVGLYFSVDHPQHPIKRIGLRPLDSQDAVELDDALQLSIRAVRDGNNEPIVADLLLKASGWSVEQPQLEGEEWIAKRLNPHDVEGGRLIRIIHAAEGQPAWYSELIDLQKQFPDAGSERLNVTLFPGVQVDGVLGGEVLRPVQGGRVCARIGDGFPPSAWQWHDVAEIAADGTFSFPSLPRDTNLQLTAICDGWVSQSPTNEENQAYAAEFGLQIPERQESDSMVWNRFFRLGQQTTSVELPMTPTYQCEVTLVSGDRPLADIEVSFWPNQLMPGIGSTLVGVGFSDLDRLRQGKDAPPVFATDWWKASVARYAAKTDADGRAVIRNLPAGNQNFGIQADGYEIEPGWFEELFGNLDQWRPDSSHTKIEADKDNRVTVQLRRKAESKTSEAPRDGEAEQQTAKPEKPKTLADQEWGEASHGLQCRLLAVSSDSFDEEPEAAQETQQFSDGEDVTFAVELRNVSRSRMTLLGVHRTNWGAGEPGELATSFYAPFVFDFEFRDENGKPINRPVRAFAGLESNVLGGASSHTMEPGKSLIVLLRPAHFNPVFDYQLPKGRYRATVRYHGPSEKALADFRERRRDFVRSNAWPHEVRSNEVSFSVEGPPDDQPARELAWGPVNDGLQAAVEFRQSKNRNPTDDPPGTFPVRRSVQTIYHVKNVSDRTIQFVTDMARQDDAITIKNAAGETSNLKLEKLGFTHIFRWTLKPGQVAELPVYGLRFQQLDQPGNYRVTCRLNFNQAKAYAAQGWGEIFQPDDWRKELVTGETTLTFRPQKPENVTPAAGPKEGIPKETTSVVHVFAKRSNDNRLVTVERPEGLGIVIDDRGFAVTAYHLVENAESIRVSVPNDARFSTGHLVASDPDLDLALIRFERKLPVTRFGTSANLKVGDAVSAASRVFDTHPRGVITALNREIKLSDTITLRNLIQCDLNLVPGDFGGPLLNAEGEVIGLNIVNRSGKQKVGLALPIDDVRTGVARLMQQVEQNGGDEKVSRTDDDPRPITAIRVTGNSHIAASEILRPLKIKKGQPLSKDDLMRIVTTLMNTRWFDLVDPTIREEQDSRELVIRVVERPIIPVHIVVAEHVILWEGKEIVTWEQVEEKLAALPNPAVLQPHFQFTRKGEARDQDKMSSEVQRLKQRFQYYGYSFDSLRSRSEPRFDRIRTADDLIIDKAHRVEGRIVGRDGNPVADAGVMLVTPIPKDISYRTYEIHISRGHMPPSMDHIMTRSDADGKFLLSAAPDENFLLLACHPDVGFYMTRKRNLAQSADIALLPWAGLDCKLLDQNEEYQVTLDARQAVKFQDDLPDIAIHLDSDVKQEPARSREVLFSHIPTFPFQTIVSRTFRDEEFQMFYPLKELTIDLESGETRQIGLGPITPQQREDLERRRNNTRKREAEREKSSQAE